ncbi:MAG: GspG family T2SS major pseudopilin variant XcpT [Gammaproteobacteria bacterium]|nr:MAG: GspG family T2SS major pseudopilin variant XcpT [Gammaproteobacteria bacterium]
MMQVRKRLSLESGFTLIEIMVVVAIIGILAALIVPNIIDEPDKAKVVKVKQDIRAIVLSLNMYKLDNHNYPTTDEGLEALVNRPESATAWRKDGYLAKLPKDPWDNEYQYLIPGTHGRIDVYSLGADKQPGGEGFKADIGNWDL